MYNNNFGIIFFNIKAKNAAIALAIVSILNANIGKKKPKLVVDNLGLVLDTNYLIKLG